MSAPTEQLIPRTPSPKPRGRDLDREGMHSLFNTANPSVRHHPDDFPWKLLFTELTGMHRDTGAFAEVDLCFTGNRKSCSIPSLLPSEQCKVPPFFTPNGSWTAFSKDVTSRAARHTNEEELAVCHLEHGGEG